MTVGALATLLVGKLQDDTVFPMIWVMCGAAVIAFLGYVLARAAQTQRAAAASAAGDD
jgi:threonine/homoserine/homoserine lactone efflux protein